MFTFGLFSTHLPYIAFVLFYAVFFFFGIEKASAVEYGEGEQIVPKEISFAMNYQRDVDNNDFYTNDACREGNINMLFVSYIGKTTLIDSENISFKSAVYLFSCFSRPPPVA